MLFVTDLSLILPNCGLFALLLVGDEDATIVAQDAIGAILGSLPFVLLALALFVAELWHGPSRRAWLFARAAVVAGPHGAGFTQLVFCPPGGRLVPGQDRPGAG